VSASPPSYYVSRAVILSFLVCRLSSSESTHDFYRNTTTTLIRTDTGTMAGTENKPALTAHLVDNFKENQTRCSLSRSVMERARQAILECDADLEERHARTPRIDIKKLKAKMKMRRSRQRESSRDDSVPQFSLENTVTTSQRVLAHPTSLALRFRYTNIGIRDTGAQGTPNQTAASRRPFFGDAENGYVRNSGQARAFRVGGEKSRGLRSAHNLDSHAEDSESRRWRSAQSPLSEGKLSEYMAAVEAKFEERFRKLEERIQKQDEQILALLAAQR